MYCVEGRGGAFVKHPVLQHRRALKNGRSVPQVSKVVDKLAEKSRGIALYKSEEFLQQLHIELRSPKKVNYKSLLLNDHS